MHEKYDATVPGKRGRGGEYTPQVGFGWTNGVVLWLLQHYAGTPLLEALGSEQHMHVNLFGRGQAAPSGAPED